MSKTKSNIEKKFFANVAFPTAVRETFTYEVETDMKISPGMRVWVPLRGSMSIGMVVHVHSQIPEFKTKKVREVLDDAPVITDELLKLTEWMHRFYYCSFGEVIQTALPVGLNFSSTSYLKWISPDDLEALPENTPESAKIILEDLHNQPQLKLEECQKKLKLDFKPALAWLKKKKWVEVWEQPEMNVSAATELCWKWVNNDTLPERIDQIRSKKSTYKWEAAIIFLKHNDILPASNKDLLGYNELSPYVLKKLEDEGFIEKFEQEVSVFSGHQYEYNPDSISELNSFQKPVYNAILKSILAKEYRHYLIYGITGSGKTEVYIHAMQKTLEMGKSALILVPEIALTPQTVRRFYRIFGSRIAILHSRLSSRERFDAWNAIRKGEKDIVIGARSALFAPVANLGLIILDEEHDTSYYQSDPAPRYNAREVASMRAYINNAVLVSGSATPSLVSLMNTSRGKSTLLKLKSRHYGANLPSIEVLDLKQYKKAMRGPFAAPLEIEIRKTIQEGNQVILLYNRRGFASYMQCDDCGHVVECPSCSVSLTYHRPLHHLRCHYCGYTERIPNECPSCSSHEIGTQGSGTQQLENQVNELFPEARILRMDQDTTSGKNAHDRILSAFGRGDADILIGTQLVAKGLDFPNVTLVGVVNADTELAFPSYRSNERTFQLLSQVAGRSGRGSKPGKVFIQTMMQDHYTIQAAQRHDYESFAKEELQHRRPLFYPPFSRIMQILFKGKKADLTEKAAMRFGECLNRLNHGFPVLGPSPDVILRMHNHFRWVIMIKLPYNVKTSVIEHYLDSAFYLYDKYPFKGSSTVRINVSHEML